VCQLGDLLPVAEPAVLPGAAAIAGAVDAVADRQVGPQQPFTARDVDDVGIGRCHRDGADRLGRLSLEDRLPGAAGVVGSPHPAVDGADVENTWLPRNPGHRARASAAHRPDQTPGEILVEAGRRLRDARFGQQEAEKAR